MPEGNKKTKLRDPALDSVKGVAILIVMIGHCIVLNGLDKDDPYIYDAIKSVQMPLFMMVSGIIASKSSLKLSSLKKRTVSYMLPFFSWFVISYIWARIRDIASGLQPVFSVKDFCSELIALLFMTDRGLWFLSTLFVITLSVTIASNLSSAIIDKIILNKANGSEESGLSRIRSISTPLLTILFSCVFYVLYFLQSRLGNTFLSPALTVQYMPFYMLGFAGGHLNAVRRMYHSDVVSEDASKDHDKKTEPAGTSAASILYKYSIPSVFFIVFVFMVIRFDLTAPAVSFAAFALQMAASFFGTLSIFGFTYGIAEKKSFKKLAQLGTFTLEIYVLHFRFARILKIAGKGLSLYSPAGFLWLILTFAVMSILTALCIFIIKKIRILDLILFGKL